MYFHNQQVPKCNLIIQLSSGSFFLDYDRAFNVILLTHLGVISNLILQYAAYKHTLGH